MLVLKFFLTTVSSFAETNDIKQKFSIGITHFGSPTIRWNKSENISLDFTPEINYTDGSESEANYQYGLDVGIIKKCKNNNSLKKGLAINLGYTYFGPSYREYRATFGIGADLEYFIPALPNLTIGSQILLNYAYSETDDGDYGNMENSSIFLSGQFLALRYYFK